MSTPNTSSAFARASAYEVLAARRVAWSRGYMVLLGSAFCASLVALESAGMSGSLPYGVYALFGLTVMFLPRLVRSLRSRRGLMVTGKHEGTGPALGSLAAFSGALLVYGAMALAAPMPTDDLAAGALLAGVGGWLVWTGRAIGVNEHLLLGAGFASGGLLLGLGTPLLAWSTLGLSALLAGLSLHTKWGAWAARVR